MKKRRTTVIILLVLVILIALVPLFLIKGAEFGGSDGKGSDMVNQITGGEYQPWFTPLMETWIGGPLPGEMESFFFCVQTGIGVGIIAFLMGRLVERKKHEKSELKNDLSKSSQ
jgi:cobalt/nickel transport protein